MRGSFQTVIGHVWTSTLMKLQPSTISLSLFYNFFAFLAWLFWSKREVCYGKYGCFQRHPLWQVQMPQNPSRIGTRFHLFTRDNCNSAQLIDDHNKHQLSASHYKISRRTIFVIHGFTGQFGNLSPRRPGSQRLRFIFFEKERSAQCQWQKGESIGTPSVIDEY